MVAPIRVMDPANHVWKALSLGGRHSCAVLENTNTQSDVIMCWGDNDQGQLGYSGSGPHSMPTAVDVSAVSPATVRWRSLTGGTDHTCAVADNGAAYCWGDNFYGQAGQVNAPFLVQARVVQGGFFFDKVAAGDDFSCGIEMTAGTLRCWGRNGSRELGNGTQTSTSTPTQVIDTGSTAKWKDLSLGLYSSCGIQGPSGSTDALGTVRCWGDNDFGQLGDGRFVTPNTGPVFGVVDNAFIVDSGHEFACAIIGDPVAGGAVKCWGDNADGQIGQGVAGDHRRPVRVGEGVRGTRAWIAIAAGRRHTCAILGGGAANELYCWGDDSEGQIDGTDMSAPRRAPVRVTAGDGATDVVVGSSHTCVRRSNATVVCFGSDQGYQLGVNGNQSPGPVTVYDTGSVFLTTGLVGAANVTCATNPSGPQCWGSPEINTTYYVESETPVALSLNGGVFPNSSFSAGPSSGCWIEGSQTLCFGINSFGQLGWGMGSTPTTQPQPVMGLTDAMSLSHGPGNHRCAITSGRVVKCWGANGYSQAGVGDTSDKNAPVTIQTPNQYDAVVTGENHTCGLNGNAIFCWGNNDQYQRTAIASQSYLPPTSIVAPMGESQPSYMQMASGEFHMCAISTAGVLYCWGAGRWGQIGDDTGSEATAKGILPGTP
jgi:alpha-tubulin suppressor-like RCC1 family protein